MRPHTIRTPHRVFGVATFLANENIRNVWFPNLRTWKMYPRKAFRTLDHGSPGERFLAVARYFVPRFIIRTVLFVYVVEQTFVATRTCRRWRRFAVSGVCTWRNAFQGIWTSVSMSNILLSGFVRENQTTERVEVLQRPCLLCLWDNRFPVLFWREFPGDSWKAWFIFRSQKTVHW